MFVKNPNLGADPNLGNFTVTSIFITPPSLPFNNRLR